MTNHLALWGFAEFAFCLTRMNPEMVYLHQDSGFLNVSYYKFDTDDVTGMLKRLAFFLRNRYSAAWGTGIRRLMRGMATLPQGNQELLVVRDKIGRPLSELGVSKSMECDTFPLQYFHTVGWATERASDL